MDNNKNPWYLLVIRYSRNFKFGFFITDVFTIKILIMSIKDVIFSYTTFKSLNHEKYNLEIDKI